MKTKTNFEGCNMKECDAYPKIENGEIIYSDGCSMCVYYQKFNFYMKNE